MKFGNPDVGKSLGVAATTPYQPNEGYVSVSGVGIRARKLEGERDVGQSRIDETGESPVATAEPAGSGTYA